MSNIHEREREKIIMYGEPQPYWEQSKEVGKEATREHVLGEGLNEWELSEHSGLTSEEQELSRLNHIAPQSVFYIVAMIIVFVLVIVGLVLLSVFHFW